MTNFITNITINGNEGFVEEPTVFNFELNSSTSLIAAGFEVIFSIDETQVIKDTRTITKAMIPSATDPKKGTIIMIFPESLAGASLKITYAFKSPIIVFPSNTTSNIEIKRRDGKKEIEKVYWSEQEHALWGAKLTVQKELCKNETGFLHIYTKGLFGKQVFTEYWDGTSSTDKLGATHPVSMRDNVVSVPYAMSKALADYMAKYPSFSGNKIELYGIVSETNPITNIKNTEGLTLWCNQDATNPQQPTTGTDVKVQITTDEEAVGEPTKAQCILQFRPDNTYNGEYGFDWVRRGDTGAPGYHHDHDFKTHMGKHYYIATMKVEDNGNNHGDAFKKDEDPNTTVLDYDTGSIDTTFGDGKMYNKLRLRHRRLIFNWDPKNSASNISETYTPIMTILNGKTAKLNLQIDIKTKPKKIVFEFDNDLQASTFLDIKVPASKEITSGLTGSYVVQQMEIECKGEFDQEFTLFARAFKEDDPITGIDPKGEICGMLRILPNGQKYQHKIKIVLFKVITNINGTKKEGKTSNGKDRLNEILGQALVIANIEEVDLDTRTDASFITDCCKQVSGVYTIADDMTKRQNLKTYLENKRDSKYDHYYKIYYFDEAEATNGYSWGEKYTLVFNTANGETGVHELLHSLELAHPFDAHSRNTPFTYKFIKTDNIMDYGHWIGGLTRKSLFHWHWQILNVKIK